MTGEVAVVIPAYNEARTIVPLVRAAYAAVPNVIVVDDGSSDDTARGLSALPITLLRNRRNRGKAASLRRGARLAIARGAERIITMDGDGQHHADEIPLLLAAAERRAGSIVIGARSRCHGSAPWSRRFANRFADFWISWACARKVLDTQSGFRLYPAEVLIAFDVKSDRAHGFVFESEILIEALRSGWQSCSVPVTTEYSLHGRASHYRPVVDTARIVRMVAGKLLRRRLDPAGLLRSLGLAHSNCGAGEMSGGAEGAQKSR